MSVKGTDVKLNFNMKKFACFFAILTMLALCFSSCENQDDKELEGSWRGVYAGRNASFYFKNGDVTFSINYNTYKSYKGYYTYKNSVVSMTFDSSPFANNTNVKATLKSNSSGVYLDFRGNIFRK